jgi:NADPH:quinone reductase-like Zn-dependent oxidoreductase
MRALVTTADRTVEFADIPEPTPTISEALIGVRATGLSRGDLHTMHLVPAGSPLGLDVVGTVLQPAADGSGPPAGTRVMGYKGSSGAWAQRTTVDTALLAPIPDGLSDEVAAALPNSGLAALAGLEAGGFLLGSRVLVTGATGGVGILAVQLAHRGGASVVAGVRSAERTGTLGAFDWLTTAAVDDLEGPFDLVVDLVGGETLGRALGLVAEDGVVASLAQSVPEAPTIPPWWFAMHPGARLVSVYNTKGQREAGRGVRRLSFLARLAERGDLDPQVTEVAPWDEANALLEALRLRGVKGKAVLRIA